MILSRYIYISIFDCIYRPYFINNWNQRFYSETWQTKHSKCMQLQLLWKRMTIKDGLWYIEILQTSKEYSTTSIIVRPLCASLSILYIFCVIVFSIAPSIKTKCHNVADRHQIYLENMLTVSHISSQIQLNKSQKIRKNN